FGQSLNADPGIDAECIAIASGFLEKLFELLNQPLCRFIGFSPGRHPTIPESCGALERGFGGPTEPDRYRTLNRHWIQTGIVDDVIGSAKRHSRLSPQLAQNFDLLFHATAACVKVLSESFVLHMVPTQADAEPQPATAQNVDFGRLLRHEH